MIARNYKSITQTKKRGKNNERTIIISKFNYKHAIINVLTYGIHNRDNILLCMPFKKHKIDYNSQQPSMGIALYNGEVIQRYNCEVVHFTTLKH